MNKQLCFQISERVDLLEPAAVYEHRTVKIVVDKDWVKFRERRCMKFHVPHLHINILYCQPLNEKITKLAFHV